MKHNQRTIDAANKILKAAGTQLDNYMPHAKEKILDATLEVMKAEYIAGSNMTYKIAVG